MVQTVWSGAGQFMKEYNEKNGKNPQDTPANCFMALFNELQR
jgi:hypothetical protein